MICRYENSYVLRIQRTAQCRLLKYKKTPERFYDFRVFFFEIIQLYHNPTSFVLCVLRDGQEFSD